MLPIDLWRIKAMPKISLDEAATRFGLSSETIEEWAKKGLLHVDTVETPGYFPPACVTEQQVDEEELAQVAESLGWLQVSAENWDDEEGE
jgi:hypothetical protein